MRRREHYWSLYHINEENQISDLKTDQVEAVYAAVPKDQRKEWLCWRESFQEWKPFENFPEFLRALRLIKDPFPAPKPPSVDELPKAPKKEVNFMAELNSVSDDDSIEGRTYTGVADLGGDDFDFMIEADSIDGRDNTRFKKEFDVRIVFGKKVFESKTIDVSLKGFKIKDLLPGGLPKFFNVEINTRQGVIPVVCSAMPNRERSGGSRLKIEMNDFMHLLQAALFAGS